MQGRQQPNKVELWHDSLEDLLKNNAKLHSANGGMLGGDGAKAPPRNPPATFPLRMPAAEAGAGCSLIADWPRRP